MKPQGIQLTPSSSCCYARDLALSRCTDTTSLAAWVEDNRVSPIIAFRSVTSEGQTGAVHRIKPIAGFPTALRTLPDRLVWIEFVEGVGRLTWARFDAQYDCPQHPETVANVASENVGDIDCCADRHGACWLLIESRSPDSRLVLIQTPRGSNDSDVSVLAEGSFFARPRLASGPDTVMASWDQYANGRYTIHSRELPGTAADENVLAQITRGNETLSRLACTREGQWFAARCREQLVQLERGVASYHSEIVVSTMTNRTWKDVEWFDIDHGLNPWMAGYTGARRFPHLLPGADRVAVLWEEKIDSHTMDPAPGRFCAAQIDSEGQCTDPIIVATDVNNLVVESQGTMEAAWLASKTQTRHNEQHLPWRLHRFTAESTCATRPDDLDSNRNAHTFEVRISRSETDVPSDRPLQLFFGDPHLHSRLSGDLDGEQDELYHFARDVSRLDFCAFCENDFHRLIEPMTMATWGRNLRNAEYFNQPGRFTVLLGWEYTKHAEPECHDPVPDSHRCILFPENRGEIHPYWDNRIVTPSPADLCARFHGRQVLLHHHHEWGFDLTDTDIERNIEICSGWGAHMANMAFRKTVHQLLVQGFRFGFFGASDNHQRNPGLGGALTGAWAMENTRAGIFEAFRARRVFATTGIRPDLRFTVADAFMGESTRVSGTPTVFLEVQADSNIKRIEIIRDGVTVHVETPQSPNADIEWIDEQCTAGKHFYYAHVKFDGKEYSAPWNTATAYGTEAWTSPVWVERA